jgi:hypothetical protein
MDFLKKMIEEGKKGEEQSIKKYCNSTAMFEYGQLFAGRIFGDGLGKCCHCHALVVLFNLALLCWDCRRMG